MQSYGNPGELDKNEYDDNRARIQGYMSQILSEFDSHGISIPSYPYLDEVTKYFLEFTTLQPTITLINLEQQNKEDIKLMAIIKAALMRERNIYADQKIKTELYEWKMSLGHAVRGRGDHISMHAAAGGGSAGIAEDLKRTGYVKPRTYLTDKDIHAVLKAKMTKPNEITEAKIYVLPEVGLDSPDEIRARINEVVNKNISGNIKLLIPATNRGSHWCLIKAEIQNKKIESVQWWDPLGKNGADQQVEEIKEKPAYKNLPKTASGADADICLAGVQGMSDNHACGMHVIREVFRELNIENEITEIKNHNDVPAITLAVVREIVNNEPDLKKAHIAEALNLDDKGGINVEKDVQEAVTRLSKFDDKDIIQENLPAQEREWQIKFDEHFATYLQNKVSPTAEINQDVLQKARRYATQKMKLFKPADNEDQAGNSAANQIAHQPPKNKK